MVSSPGPCASSGGRLPEALFMLFLLGSKVQKRVNDLVDLGKSFQTRIFSKFGFDTAEKDQPAEKEPLKVCQN